MKHLISTSAHAMAKVTPLPDCIEILHQAGFKVTDFWLWKFSNTEDAPLYQENWREWTADVRRKLEEKEIAVGQVHAHWDHPWQVNDDFSFELPREIFHRSIEATHLLGSHKLIFHPIQRFSRVLTEEDRRRVLDANVAWFGALLPTAEKFGVELHIENTFDYKDIQLPGDPHFTNETADDLMYIIEKLDHPLMKICLDTGHANIAGQDIPAMIRRFGSKLNSLHMNDNYGRIGPIYPDIHIFPGYGRVPWKDVFAALKEVGYEGTLNMEPNGELPKLPYGMRVIQLRAAIDCVRFMAEEAGL